MKSQLGIEKPNQVFENPMGFSKPHLNPHRFSLSLIKTPFKTKMGFQTWGKVPSGKPQSSKSQYQMNGAAFWVIFAFRPHIK